MVNLSSRRLGRYDLVDVLGKGAMGTVYRGWDPDLARPVAIKVIQAAQLEPGVVERFRREAQALARLAHPHIVGIYDLGTENGAPFIVMEMVEGLSLALAIRQSVEYSVGDKLRMTAEVCSALECAHAAGIVHRDVKPANILIAQGTRAKLVDFGLARLHDSSLTGSSNVVGTPAYMAPEAYTGREVDSRADLYGLAASLYEWLCGSRPHTADDPVALMALALNHDAPDIRSKWPGCPPALAECLKRGLARSPDARFQSAREFGDALRGIHLSTPLVSIHDQPTALISTTAPTVSIDLPRPRNTSRDLLIAGVAAAVLSLVVLRINGAWVPVHSESGSAAVNAGAVRDSAVVRAAPPAILEQREKPRPTRGPTEFVVPAAGLDTKAAQNDVDEEPPAEAPTIPIGTRVLAAILTQLRTDRTVAGQEFEARLAEPIVLNGREIVPLDAELRGIVDTVVPGRPGQAPSLQLSLMEIRIKGQTTRIRTARYTVEAPGGGAGSGRALTIIIGAAVGTAVGGVAGGESGAVVGAAVGAVAGAAVPARNGVGGEYVLGNQLTFKLVEPMRLPPGAE